MQAKKNLNEKFLNKIFVETEFLKIWIFENVKGFENHVEELG